MNLDEIEQLSNLMDDQPGFSGSCLDKVIHDKHWQACWRSYHLIGEALRKNLPFATRRQFVDEIMEKINQEPALKPTLGNILHLPVWTRPVWTLRMAGFAIAASMAIIVVTLIPQRLEENRINSEKLALGAPNATAQVPQVSNPQVSNNGTMGMMPSHVASNMVPALSNSTSVNLQSLTPEINFVLSNLETGNDQAQMPPLYHIDEYVFRHSVSSSLSGSLPYARIVGYLSEK